MKAPHCTARPGFSFPRIALRFHDRIAEGDVARKLIIPIYSVFPRLFTCPTMLTKTFKVEFECNLIIIFADGYMITENFPLLLYR